MSQPNPYTPTTDFSQQEAINASGRSTVNTAALDTEFANIQTTVNATIDNLALIQRDDGRLGDLTVGVSTLTKEVLNLMGGFNLRGLWAPDTDYAVNDICSSGEYTYCCTVAHTSGVVIDLAKWIQFGFTSGEDAAQAAAAAQVSASAAASSSTSAANSASAATISATQAANSASAATISATQAANSASAATISATQAANSAAQAASSAIPVQSGHSGPMVTNGAVASWIDSQMSMRNKITNGGFTINQRAVTGTVALAAGAYGHDRWKAGASGCTYTFSIANNVTTLNITAGSLVQVIEGSSLISGTHVLSWSGTAQGRVDSGAYGASGVTGTAIGGTNQSVEFGIGTLAKVQYEQGSIVTPFEHRPYGMELILCKRYFEYGYFHPEFQGYATLGATAGMQTVSFAVTKRVIPTCTIFSASYYINGTPGATPGAVQVVGQNAEGFSLYVTSCSNYMGVSGGAWTADSEL
jgi:hypothetical protein